MVTRPWILGMSASHNGAVCIMHGDEVVVAIQEERLTRRKRARVYGAAPSLAVQYCLDFAGISAGDLDLVVLSAQGHLASPEHAIRSNTALEIERHGTRVVTISHHLAHAVSAFATSGFDEAGVLVVDGCGSPVADLSDSERSVLVNTGQWETISLYAAKGTTLTPIEKHTCANGEFERPAGGRGMPYPRSLGGIFSAASVQIFGDATEAGKVMGLAPYGRPSIEASEFFRIIDGRFEFSDAAAKRYSYDERWPKRSKEYETLAASCQAALELGILDLCGRLRQRLGRTNFCYAGGVALNSVANERIVAEAGFAQTYFFPAAEDSGVAVGAAYYGLWQLTRENRRRRLSHDAFGRAYSADEVAHALRSCPAVVFESSENTVDRAVDLLCQGKIIGWFQGRSELGPRALGQRSILCDPRSPSAKEQLNARVKHREGFRPFAPSVLEGELGHWFEPTLEDHSPFMLRVLRFLPGKAEQVPAVAHVDGTGRVQTLTPANGRFFDLVSEFFRRTRVPMLLNTSFNIMGEPIVETPEEALWALLSTDLDAVVFDDHVVTRKAAFRSVLDLRPRLADSILSIEPPIAAGAPVASAGEDLVITMQTRWGPIQSRYPGHVAHVLEAIDGRSSGWQVLERISSDEVTDESRRQFIRLIGMLRRQFILSFDELDRSAL